MRYGKYCPAYKDGICLGSIFAGRKMMRCEEILSDNICDWFEEKYIKNMQECQTNKTQKIERIDIIQEILLKYFSMVSCSSCRRFPCTDDRCSICENYWELDEYFAHQLAERIVKAIEE